MRSGDPSLVAERFALAGVAGLLLFLAAAVVACGGPISGANAAGQCDGIAGRKSFHSHPAITAAPEIFAIRRFPHDKRQPRAPRHRSERPSTFSADRDLTAAVIFSITHDDMHRPLQTNAVSPRPLSGHYLELLRPPSVCA